MLRYPEAWEDTDRDSLLPDGKHHALVRCAVARSVIAAARAAGVRDEAQCEAALHVVERWCNDRANAAEVRTAEREVVLRNLELDVEDRPALEHRRRICEATLRACEEARLSFDGASTDRSSQTSLM